MITFNFDVLARPASELAKRQPDPDGRALWNLFSGTLQHMCIVVDEDVDRRIFEHWLIREGLKASTIDFLDSHEPLVKAEKIHHLTTMFGRAGWYVDTDPRTIALTIAKGIPSLLVGSPHTIRPEWEEEPEIRPWDAVVAELDRQKMKKAQRTWENDDDEESDY